MIIGAMGTSGIRELALGHPVHGFQWDCVGLCTIFRAVEANE